jgi:hypothetical protein
VEKPQAVLALPTNPLLAGGWDVGGSLENGGAKLAMSTNRGMCHVRRFMRQWLYSEASAGGNLPRSGVERAGTANSY